MKSYTLSSRDNPESAGKESLECGHAMGGAVVSGVAFEVRLKFACHCLCDSFCSYQCFLLSRYQCFPFVQCTFFSSSL